MSSKNETVTDDQTGKAFTVVPERWFDVVAAWISIIYSLLTILYLAYLLLDTWTDTFSPWYMKLYVAKLGTLNLGTFKLVVYSAIGGGIGAAVNNIRSFVGWHAELKAFGWRFVWKYIAMPPLGATLAVMVYAIIRGGVAVFNGGTIQAGKITFFSAWATGALAGYGSHKVFIWLDDKVNSLFKVEDKTSQTGDVTVPDVSGKTRDEAEQALKEGKLALGAVSEEATSESEKVGKVIAQDPASGTKAALDSRVAITVGKSPDGDSSQSVTVDVPDLSGKTHDAAKQTLEEGHLALGAVSEEATGDEGKVGFVTSQDPAPGAKVVPDSQVAVTIGKAPGAAETERRH